MIEMLLKDGSKLNLNDSEWGRLRKRIVNSWNLRHFILDSGDVLFMDERCPIMLVKLLEPDQVEKHIEEGANLIDHLTKVHKEIIPEEQEEKKETPNEKQDRMLKEIIDKSSCVHKKEDSILYKQNTKTGLKYFYVCDYCGKRERFVKKDKLVDEGIDLETARIWVEG